MQEGEKPQLLKLHPQPIGCLSCSFHPKEQYLFVSGGSADKLQFSCALTHTLKKIISKKALTSARAINGVRFTSDGLKVITTSTSRKTNVVDVEKGVGINSYENSASPVEARQPIATHKDIPFLVACISVNGRGITLFDLRMPLPLDFLLDLHETRIGDITFLDGSWPWGSGHITILSAGDGVSFKISSLNGRMLYSLPSCRGVYALAPSPGAFKQDSSKLHQSVIVAAGEGISCFSIEKFSEKSVSFFERLTCSNSTVSRAMYNHNGGLLYTANSDGMVYRYRRHPGNHSLLGHVISHKSPVNDIDISPLGEYLISASSDGTVGVLKLGFPTHGCSQYCEFT